MAYKIQGSILGSGAYAHVWKAVSVSSGVVCALKKSRVSLRVKRTILRHEGRVLQLLQGHPAIPSLFGYGRVAHFEYLALELLVQSMKDVMADGHALKLVTVARIGAQMLSALEHLHANGIVHRDIKHENILVSSNPSRICLIDFGIARRLSSGELQAAPSRRYKPIEDNRHVIGTLNWCSLRAHEGFDLRPRDDLESLAYSLIFLLCGDVPWRNGSNHESTRHAMARIYAAKQHFTGASLDASLPSVFGDLLDHARSDHTSGIAEIRMELLRLASSLGGTQDAPLDWTPGTAIYPSQHQDAVGTVPESDGGPEDASDNEPNKEYSNSYFAWDIDMWDYRQNGRDLSLTFPVDEAQLLDGRIPEIVVIDDTH